MPFHIATDSVFSSLYPTSSVVRVIEVRAFSLPDLFDLIEVRPLDLLKMDIEGAEIELLNTCPPSILRQIRQISVEFHDHCDLTPASEVSSTLAHLHKLGFFSVHGDHDTWLINRNLCDITTAELKFIQYAPTWMGIRRVARRQAARFASDRSHRSRPHGPDAVPTNLSCVVFGESLMRCRLRRRERGSERLRPPCGATIGMMAISTGVGALMPVPVCAHRLRVPITAVGDPLFSFF